MKALLVAINAKYIHSNLAVHSLKAYASQQGQEVDLEEYTINHGMDEILHGIYRTKPNFIGFSCYIWNIEMIKKIADALHVVLPETKIWFGGPEVSYDYMERLKLCSFLDGIMIGEGEKTLTSLLLYYRKKGTGLEDIHGIAYRDEKGDLRSTAGAVQMDLNELPFPYKKLYNFENRIIYYETSRGCPFSCSYCLSSLDKKVRFRSLDKVKLELKFFLDQSVRQVKFIDRTFNCNRDHARQIWNYIKENDNGITNFHFEISADLLEKEDFDIIRNMREGLIQFEIGVQTTNERTLEAIGRKADLGKLKAAVRTVRERKNIHQHLDLIAGLPYEDFESFRNSFMDVYQMKPDQLQLGFLKVLKGSFMKEETQTYGIVCHSVPPYEVLATKWITFDKIIELKMVEEMVEIYYNSGQFKMSIAFLEHLFENPFDLYHSIGSYYKSHFDGKAAHSRIQRYQLLLDYYTEIFGYDKDAFSQLLTYDLYIRENLKKRPDFAIDEDKKRKTEFYNNKELLDNYLPDYKDYQIKQIMRMTHMERFYVDIKSMAETGNVKKRDNFILFDYKKRDILHNDAGSIEVFF